MTSLFEFTAPKAYEYTPLDTSRRTFRLIELLPPKPSLIPGRHGTARVRIFERDVDDLDAPEYDALSYTWSIPRGVTEPDRRIIVEAPAGAVANADDGVNSSRELRVYRPLELALLYLSEDLPRRPLFIDQVSMDQRNPAEKGVQVPLMHVIYARCARTLVWLGPETRASDRFFDFVTRELLPGGDAVLGRILGPRVSSAMRVFDAVVSQRVVAYREGAGPRDDDEEDNEENRLFREDRDAMLDLVLRYGEVLPRDGMADVLARPWYNRLWTIQEAALAPLVVFVCGRRTLCFDCMRAVLFYFNVANTHWVGGDKARRPAELRERAALLDLGSGMGRIWQERKAVHQLRRRKGLYDVLLRYNLVGEDGGGVIPVKIGAKLSEDRVFALLGLVDEADPLVGRVRVRYGDDGVAVASQVYTEVAGLLLEESVDALLFAQTPRTTPGLPSWVPDWAMDLRLPVGYSRVTEPVYAASGKDAAARAPHFVVDEAAGRLTIRGVAIDKVVRVGTRVYRVEPEKHITDVVDYRWARLVFEEVDEFVRDARGGSHDRSRSEDDDEARQLAHRRTCLRVCDSGLSWRMLWRTLGSESAAMAKLSGLESQISQLGERLLRVDATRKAYHITRIYRTVGITPWYWIPAPETDALRMLACDPLAALRVLRDAAVDFFEDMVGLVSAAAAIDLASRWIALRRRFQWVNLKQTPEAVARLGLDPNMALDRDMGEFTHHLIKNVRRTVYTTEGGRVGMGPEDMVEGDEIVVLYGGTVPHVLRDRGDGTSIYMGAAYCDGVMDGEALTDGVGRERDFVLT
ncbi:NADH-ubiquinone oxidoreductase 9.5 kDa subunit [Purpureocillium lavendulum]|uniref:NADH-ubiquinone oxidoreductase 9.5 kDa subunit n=1 Tax=Purpureocillium lavendulum TaxID=1247861 RepID=A0AB34G5Z7_9HYPO|nr:NADH-ubiquinone oxidoreductase 9.5 kDa subunit [Purpureocillium lavendulum]